MPPLLMHTLQVQNYIIINTFVLICTNFDNIRIILLNNTITIVLKDEDKDLRR